MNIRPSSRSSFRKIQRSLLLSTAALCLGAVPTSASADAPSVVTTIKPLHSIASAVMEGVGSPHILIDGAASPHGFALKPSQAFLLQGADVVFWVGPELAPSLAKPISSMAEDAHVVELMDATGIDQLKIREGANFDSHDHAHGDHDHDHDHDDHEDHAGHDDHDDHDDHAGHDGHDDHEDHADHDDHDDHGDHAGHDDHDDHEDHEDHAGHEAAHGEAFDPHIWLNPDNGIAIAGAMAETLAELDPDNAATYRENAANFSARVEALEGDIAKQLEPVSGKKFVVFHDAYHHFEHHFGIEASGAITLSPEALSSADRIAEVRKEIKDLDVTCVFQEPQFDAKLVDVVLEGSSARKATLDPLGTQLTNGPDLYPELLDNLSTSLADCLGGQS
ncbi:zinc ABC transporter substrate-binding protein [Labrenzia sp. 011]|uniref:zinc ABC transporter substrate-binding protein n=1 Tax=Labrenzia sp. 011 TaxID=2171494 RepID=UPI000D51762F|nr:zinc ABC transporter substrate-binding protein [Labrenzia sp. 011]PVB63694.1 zinc ABC transporter substrate-binding protein [Labrenzia sp. 011]